MTRGETTQRVSFIAILGVIAAWIALPLAVPEIRERILGGAGRRAPHQPTDTTTTTTAVTVIEQTPPTRQRISQKKPEPIPHEREPEEPRRVEVAPQAAVPPVQMGRVEPAQEPVVLKKTEIADFDKPTTRATDGTYVAKVIRCPEAGGPGVWSGWSNEGKLCVDVGDRFMTARFDGTTRLTIHGSWHKPTDLEAGDVIRMRVNDGLIIKMDFVKNVRE